MQDISSLLFDLPQWLQAFICIAFVLAIAYLLMKLVYVVLFYFEKRDRFLLPKASLIKFRSPLYFFFVLIIMLVYSGLSGISVSEIPWLGKFYNMLVILNFAWGAIIGVQVMRKMIMQRYDVSLDDNLKARKVSTQIRFFEKFLIGVIAFLAISFALMTIEEIRMLGVNMLASAGVAGIILGLAAQRSLGTYLAGIQIAITQPIRIDDVVIVENEWGWIEEINLTYVVVRIWDLRRLVVPISYFIENPFQNWTRTTSDILGSVFIYADYTIPVQALREELTRILGESPDWDEKVNVLQVTNATEHTLEIRALMSAKSSPVAWNLRVYVREKLIEFMQNNYPQCLPKTRIEMNQTAKSSGVVS